MRFTITTSLLLASSCLGSAVKTVDARAPVVKFRELEGRGEVIAALLRAPASARSNHEDVVARQADTCSVGYLPCSDGQGCCPAGEYCGEWGGKLGCCPIGKSCVANDDVCEFVGDVKCANYDFCCPTGYTCYIDSLTNSGKCSPFGAAFNSLTTALYANPTASSSSSRTSSAVKSAGTTLSIGFSSVGATTATGTSIAGAAAATATSPFDSLNKPNEASQLTPQMVSAGVVLLFAAAHAFALF